MEFSFGHHHNHHHRPESDPDQNPNPYPPPAQDSYGYQPDPPPYYGGGLTEFAPPPPPFQHVSHEYSPPPAPYVQHVSHEGGYSPPPPEPYVQHVSHEGGYAGGYESQRPGFFPSTMTVEHVGHESRVGHGSSHVSSHASNESKLGELTRQPPVRVFTKADENYSLSIREGNVVLVPANPRDEYQHWYKDLKYSTRVKDEEGLPSFALVNKVTGQAIKHSVGASHPVRLVQYNPDYLDESVLWTESKDTGENFRCIRMVNNIGLNFDAFHGDEDHGGVRDGTHVVLWEWCKGKNQRWKIVPY